MPVEDVIMVSVLVADQGEVTGNGTTCLSLVTWCESMRPGCLRGLILRSSDLAADYQRLVAAGVRLAGRDAGHGVEGEPVHVPRRPGAGCVEWRRERVAGHSFPAYCVYRTKHAVDLDTGAWSRPVENEIWRSPPASHDRRSRAPENGRIPCRRRRRQDMLITRAALRQAAAC